MRFIYLLSILYSSILINPGYGKQGKSCCPDYLMPVCQDTIYSKQILYNGRIWRNLYAGKVQGNQFLFSDRFLKGSVSAGGKRFENIMLRYDICNDEIMIITGDNRILQLNKELIDGFTLTYNDITHIFIRTERDSTTALYGYAEVLYRAKSVLYVKHIKEISSLKEGKILEIFQPVSYVYVEKDGVVNNIRRPGDFKGLLDDKRQQVRSYMKSNRIRLSTKSPGSFIPVLKFYDGL